MKYTLNISVECFWKCADLTDLSMISQNWISKIELPCSAGRPERPGAISCTRNSHRLPPYKSHWKHSLRRKLVGKSCEASTLLILYCQLHLELIALLFEFCGFPLNQQGVSACMWGRATVVVKFCDESCCHSEKSWQQFPENWKIPRKATTTKFANVDSPISPSSHYVPLVCAQLEFRMAACLFSQSARGNPPTSSLTTQSAEHSYFVWFS